MALPTSGPLSMQDIATEFGVSLSNVALNATLGPYAGGSPGTAISISDFYGLAGLTSFSYNASGQSGPPAACPLGTIGDTAYHNGSGTYPVAGDNVYSDSSGTSLLAVATYKFVGGGPKNNFLVVNPAGEVYVAGRCRN